MDLERQINVFSEFICSKGLIVDDIYILDDTFYDVPGRSGEIEKTLYIDMI